MPKGSVPQRAGTGADATHPRPPGTARPAEAPGAWGERPLGVFPRFRTAGSGSQSPEGAFGPLAGAPRKPHGTLRAAARRVAALQNRRWPSTAGWVGGGVLRPKFFTKVLKPREAAREQMRPRPRGIPPRSRGRLPALRPPPNPFPGYPRPLTPPSPRQLLKCKRWPSKGTCNSGQAELLATCLMCL